MNCISSALHTKLNVRLLCLAFPHLEQPCAVDMNTNAPQHSSPEASPGLSISNLSTSMNLTHSDVVGQLSAR